MYLIIGHEDDLCSRLIFDRLRACGQTVVMTSNPLAGDFHFSWRLESDRSLGRLHRADAPVIKDDSLQGVVVRCMGSPDFSEGFSSNEDHLYMCQEAHAAMLAWLHGLPCPVINRPAPEWWFQPRRSILEWRPLLRRSGLPVPRVCITNAPDWETPYEYVPLTVRDRYAINSDDQRLELLKVAARLPVCLVDACTSTLVDAWVLARSEVFWDGPADVCTALTGQREGLEHGLRTFALASDLDLLKVSISVEDSPTCTDVDVWPDLRLASSDCQRAVVDALLRCIGGF